MWFYFQLQDAFGLCTEFVGLANFAALFRDENYLESFQITAVFSVPARTANSPLASSPNEKSVG